MFLIIVLLFFFGVNWIASYVMAIIPIHLFTFVGSFLQFMLLIMIFLLFTWFFGD